MKQQTYLKILQQILVVKLILHNKNFITNLFIYIFSLIILMPLTSDTDTLNLARHPPHRETRAATISISPANFDRQSRTRKRVNNTMRLISTPITHFRRFMTFYI